MSSSMLRGRLPELAVIDALLRAAGQGHGGGLLLRGEPGIGKSALLEEAGRRGKGMHVLHASGVEPEAELSFATLHGLLRPALGQLDRLPSPQRRALRVAFGQQAASAPDRFLVALAALTLLSELAADQPVVCLIDDAQWADRASLDTFGFLARRIDAEPIAIILAARSGEGNQVTSTGLTTRRLGGLSQKSARELLLASGGDRLTRSEQDELLRASGGNPLAIREYAKAPPGGRRGEPLPMAHDLRRVFMDRVNRLGRDPQTLLLLCAADGSGRLTVLRRAAAALAANTVSLDNGELDEFLTNDGAAVQFRHPLIRSAVYHGSNPALRRAVHRALASALPPGLVELERRAWHLGQAAAPPDEVVAAELERAADRASRRAGPAAAAIALGRAAELSRTEIERGRRSVAAARLWLEAGDTSRAAGLLRRIDQAAPGSVALRLDVMEMRSLIELRTGKPSEAVALLRAALPDIPLDDRRRLLRLCMLLGESAFLADLPEAGMEILAALEREPVRETDVYAAMIRLLKAGLRAYVGLEPELTEDDLAALERLTDPVELYQASGIAWSLGRFDLARRVWTKAAREARIQGAAGSLAWILLIAVVDELGAGSYETAEAYAEEGYRLAEEIGQPNTVCRHKSLLAVAAAIRGQSARVRRLTDDVLAHATAHDLPQMAAFGNYALGLLNLASGQYTDALHHLEKLHTRVGTVSGVARAAIPDLAEAAVRSGKPEHAATLVHRFETWAGVTGTPAFLALAARCRALLAAADLAEPAFYEALAQHAKADRPFDQARTRLLLGEHLRRQRRRFEARPHLRAALETFSRLAAPIWAERARGELRAAGGSTELPDTRTLASLTAREMGIALALADGATNREIAARLFLSRRTVDYHLRKIFQKTGITSRAELVRLVLAYRQR